MAHRLFRKVKTNAMTKTRGQSEEKSNSEALKRSLMLCDRCLKEIELRAGDRSHATRHYTAGAPFL
jgi:hypothetical protein